MLFSGAAPTRALTEEEVQDMGADILPLMSVDQLMAAASYYYSTAAPTKHYMVSLNHLQQVWANHWQRVLRMPAGGAHAGGALQTGFEMELVSASAVRLLMADWTNHQSIRFGHSWELRSMEEAGKALGFSKWGMLNAKPMPPVSGSDVHRGLIMAAPPITATWRLRNDATSVLVVRLPLVLWMEDNSTILPPNDSSGIPFYVDPEDQPGLHRDLFQGWARRVLGELVLHGFPMSPLACTHLPREYRSDEESSEGEWEEGSPSQH